MVDGGGLDEMYDAAMSEVLGTTLPDELHRTLSSPPSGARLGEAILIATARNLRERGEALA